jgi:hypothetical protein
MLKAEDGRAFIGQYRIEARPRPEGVSLRLSFDADILLRLATDTGARARLELADVAGTSEAPPTLSWRRHGVGIAFTLLGLSVALASLVWLAHSPPSADEVAPWPPPSLPEPPLAEPHPLQPAAPAPPLEPAKPAPPVIRLDPAPPIPAPPIARAPLPRALATAPPPKRPPAQVVPAAPPALERPATAKGDGLDLFDDTK